MSRNSQKRWASISRISITFALVITLILPNFFLPEVAKAATFKDIKKHWAESYIEKAVGKGLVKGFSDGTFQPDKPVTRAEFAAMVNRLLKNNATSYANFSDVNRNDWFYGDVAKAVSAAYVGGYKDGTFKPGDPTSRQEAAVMLSRFLPVAGINGNISTFVDAGTIENWSREAVAKINTRGYLKGYPDGAFHPKDNITRAMVAKILCEISDNENIISANTSVSSGGTSLSNRIYSNNVDIQSSLREGNATLSNVVILGTLNVYGGGDKSIRIDDSRIANANIKKSNSPVRVLLSSHSVVVNADLSEKAILETQNLSGGIFGKGFQNVNIERNANVALRGDFDKINLNGSNAALSVERGTVKTLETSSYASNSTIKIESRARIERANANAKVAFTGDGTVDELNAMVSGITYAKKPNRIYTSNGASSPTEDTSSNLEIQVSPKDKENNVSTNEDIVLTFKERIVNLKDKEISKSEIMDAIEIRKDRKSGTSIQYTVSISNNGRKFTLDPRDSLDKDTTYYVIIRDRMLKYEDGKKIDEQITSFYTGKDNKVGDASFYPKDGATRVERKVNPTIKFDEAIELKNGSSITSKRLKDWIEFREKNSSGTRVDFEASIDKYNKEITIEPRYKLNNDQKYYLEINGAGFRYTKNSNSVRGGSVTWTVGENTDIPKVTITPTNGSTGLSTDTRIYVTFDKTVYKNNKAERLTNDYISSNISLKLVENGTSVNYTVTQNNSNPTKLTLTPKEQLLSGKQYDVIVDSSFYDDDKNTNRRTTSRFTVKGVTINTSALDTALNDAEKLKSGVLIDTDPKNVEVGKSFVSQSEMDAFNAAILEARKSEHRTSELKAANAAIALRAAMTSFERAKKEGTKPNVSELTNEIQKAEQALSSTPKSDDNGLTIAEGSFWVTQEDKAALSEKINTAKAYRDNPTDASTVEAETNNLKAAELTFERAKKPGKSGLALKIVAANRLNQTAEGSSSEGADISTDKKWVPQDIKNALTNAISDAETERDKVDSTSSSVQDATNKLQEAMGNFDPKPGKQE